MRVWGFFFKFIYYYFFKSTQDLSLFPSLGTGNPSADPIPPRGNCQLLCVLPQDACSSSALVSLLAVLQERSQSRQKAALARLRSALWVLAACGRCKDHPIAVPHHATYHAQGGHQQPKYTSSHVQVLVCILPEAEIDAELVKAESFTEVTSTN